MSSCPADAYVEFAAGEQKSALLIVLFYIIGSRSALFTAMGLRICHNFVPPVPLRRGVSDICFLPGSFYVISSTIPSTTRLQAYRKPSSLLQKHRHGRSIELPVQLTPSQGDEPRAKGYVSSTHSSNVLAYKH